MGSFLFYKHKYNYSYQALRIIYVDLRCIRVYNYTNLTEHYE